MNRTGLVCVALAALLLAGCAASKTTTSADRGASAVATGGTARAMVKAPKAGSRFKDCRDCPEMVVVPPGEFDMGFDGGEPERYDAKWPFILVGVLAFLLLAVLAATSFDRAIRGLGGKRWRALHRAVYAVAILAVLHFYWMRAGKNDFAEVLVYGVLLAMLLGWRVWHQWRRRRIEAAQRHAVSVH